MQRLLSQIGRSQRLAVLNLIKRAPEGLAVRFLAERLKMSYMGVKQICLDLERDGYLDTFRNHRGVGRPEILYRLTGKARDLFPQADNALSLSLLEQARKLYGAGAPEKMLFLYFQDRTQDYLDRIRGETAEERARWLVRMREREGYMADLREGPPLLIVENHHPMQALIASIPRVAELEREMFQKILGIPVRRQQSGEGGNYRCEFQLG
jgi:predicted ArsR family transcriptional regulator